MKGRIRRDIPSMINGDFFFREGETVECGYHDEEEGLMWAQNPGYNPPNSLDFLTADDIEILEEEEAIA